MANQSNTIAAALLAYAAQRNLDVTQLATLSNIDPAELITANGKIIDSSYLSNLWHNAAHQSGDPLFGLHFGEASQLAALGAVEHIIKTSATVGEALTLAAALTPTITDLFKMVVRQKKGSVEIDLVPLKNNTVTNFSVYQTIDLILVIMVRELDGLLFTKMKPDAIFYAGVINDEQEYERVLRCRMQKHKYLNRLVFNRSFWDEPIITANHEIQRIFIEKNENIKKIVGGQGISARTKNYLLSNAYLGLIQLDELARNFNMSSRTLQRKLKAEGNNYQVIADEVRKILAVEYLKNNNTSLKEISFSLGYNELSAFTRSFKRWTGLAPNIYRQTLS